MQVGRWGKKCVCVGSRVLKCGSGAGVELCATCGMERCALPRPGVCTPHSSVSPPNPIAADAAVSVAPDSDGEGAEGAATGGDLSSAAPASVASLPLDGGSSLASASAVPAGATRRRLLHPPSLFPFHVALPCAYDIHHHSHRDTITVTATVTVSLLLSPALWA